MNEKLVIFDLDGTLYKTEMTFPDAVGKACEEFSLPVPDRQILLSMLGETSEVVLRRLMPGVADDVRDDFRSRIRSYERELIRQNGALYPGIRVALEKLASLEFTAAICSNASAEYIDLVLSSCSVREHFRYFRGCSAHKSKSDMIRELLDEAKTSDAVVVGDRGHDFAAARANKLASIGVSYGYGKDEISEADFTARSPSEIVYRAVQCDLFYQIEQGLGGIVSDGPKIVGINGIDLSGKSTFAESLARYLRARGHKIQIVHLDDFHNRRKVRYQGSDPIGSYIEHAFNLEQLVAELLAPARQKKSVDKELALLDLEADDFTNARSFRIDERTIVILEGVLLYREPVDEYFDYRIFLDIGFDEMLHRAGTRDAHRFGTDFVKRYRDKYIPVQKWYLKQYSPRRKCDIVIDNADYNYPGVKGIG